MSRTPEEPREPASETAQQPASSPQQPEQELTLEQLDAHIADAEGLHQDLSARLDSIPRD